MARARNIKPSFFTNEQLADSCPLGRLLFIGLWTLADYKGDIEWKEKTIKIQLLPWDDCNIKELAINLDKSGLIQFYSVGGKIYIHVVNFVKHQNPHKNEKDKGSCIPRFSDSYRQAIDLKDITINHDLSGLKPEDSHSDPADSLLLNPSTLNPVIPESQQVASQDKPAKKTKAAKSELDYSSWPQQPDEQILNDWIAMRKHKKGSFSQTVIEGFGKEFVIAMRSGYSVNECLEAAIMSNWTGFKFSWLQNQNSRGHQNGNAGQPKSPIERFMQQHYPNPGSGFENDQRPVGGNDGAIRGAMDSQLRGESGQIWPMAPDIIGDFSRTDS